jgi:hypothetical protein
VQGVDDISHFFPTPLRNLASKIRTSKRPTQKATSLKQRLTMTLNKTLLTPTKRTAPKNLFEVQICV